MSIRPPSRALRRLRAIAPWPAPRPVAIGFDTHIRALKPARIGGGDYLLPGFIDLQINGAYGIDVMSATVGDLLLLAERLAREGVAAWLPTVITAPLEIIERIDGVVAAAIAVQTEAARSAEAGRRPGATILGTHLEGPFISPRRLGAHPPLALAPRGPALRRILGLRTPRLITIAPELDGALGAIRRITSHGIAVSIGHTDATFAQAAAGVAAGARMFTHLFNAMPPLRHRAPGPIGVAMPRACAARAAIIADGTHLDPAVVQIVYQARGPAGVILTTDRVAPAGADKRGGQTIFGGARTGVTIRGGAARLPDGTLAGGAATMLEMARHIFPEFNRDDLSALGQITSGNAAETLDIRDRGRIAPRARADFVLLDRNLSLKAVFLGGRELA